ncbi:CPBP family intramembrane glutamic endopeptidase [Thermoflavimicrobium daqui]|uniref:CAAX prenyl protease 2/Lysostaphin resistance protein A-like domain-containing protein n=1 Tax=Thermoflavimicrobium daqui TaxID=2137476 RepID=A0A364K3C3_9BACL|nr:CPBP family intramembrane glutamic endopeptidase [Thermoflavimicrobium daqui]RAL23332.1 hypothetical protein DL897_11600 [Thermoflavimicrobium daqui]
MSNITAPILSNLFTFGPIIVLFYLMNFSEKRRTESEPQKGQSLAVVLYVCLIIVFGLFILIGLANHLLSTIPTNGLEGLLPLSPLDQKSLKIIGLGLWIPSLIAIIVLIPAVRRGIAHLIPIDPTRRVHAISLSLSLLVFIQLFTTLGIGLDILSETEQSQSLNDTLATIWSQDLLLVLLGFIGVGWLTHRNGKEALARLGIVKPTWKLILLGIIFGVVFSYIAQLLELIAVQLGFTGDPDVNKLTEKWLGSLFTSTFGVITLGVAAALGEETIFRGAMQPRFGIILTAILFTFTHANYGFSLSAVIVLIFAFVLGFLRQRFNTTFTMIVHATYNMSLVVLPTLNL